MYPELLREHRELQYLRAAARARPSKRLRPAELKERQRYAELRWRKLLALDQGNERRMAPRDQDPDAALRAALLDVRPSNAEVA